MKQILFFLLVVFYTSSTFSQNYLIDFESSDTQYPLDSVLVLNLNTNESLLVDLSDKTSAIENNISGWKKQKIYPNPCYGELYIELSNSISLPAFISFTDLTGRIISRELIKISSGNKIIISNIPNGTYVLSVNTSENKLSKLIISQNNLNDWSGLTTNYVANTKTHVNSAKKQYSYKSYALNDSSITGKEGERLLLTGYSGNMKTVISFMPTKDTTISFSFYPCTDWDNNNYKVVEIGEQIWMAENLKTTKFNDNTEIPLVTDSAEWWSLTTPGYCWYKNDEDTYAQTYGALYNWHTVGTEKLCPVGWHVPTDNEWEVLTNYLGGEGYAGGKLKETSTPYWDSPNTAATNETGFSALPAGARGFDYCVFGNIGKYCTWWGAGYCSNNGVSYDSNELSYFDYGAKWGLSVRCVRD